MPIIKDSQKDCVYIVRDCSDPDLPAITDDCGINDRVVRVWAQTPYRNTADPVQPQKAVLVGVCEE